MDLQAALWFARAGWPVFPTSPDTKRPLLKGSGFKDATRDESVIGGIWGRYKNAMVAVPTGAPIGHFVVDLDPGNAPELGTWQAMLADLELRIGVKLPRSNLEVETPRKGLHLYFRMPEPDPETGEIVEIRNTTGLKLFKGEANEHKLLGVDIRGDGGYVVVPPSVRRGPQAIEDGCDGVAYNWIKSQPQALLGAIAPPELLAHVIHKEEILSPEAGRAMTRTALELASETGKESPEVKFAYAALDGEYEKVANAPKGTRNAALNNAALALGGLGAHGLLTFQVVESALLSACAASGLLKSDGRRQCEATIRSGWGAGLRNPRDLSHVGRRAGSASGDAGGKRPQIPLDQLAEIVTGQVIRIAFGGKSGGGAGGADGSDAASGGDGEPPDGEDGGDDGEDPPDPAIVERNAAEPLNDLGNARRLLNWFGPDILVVRDVGEHVWTGSHWTTEGAPEAFQRAAQITGERIRLEAPYLKPSRRDLEILKAAAAARKKEEDDRDAGEKAAIIEADRISMRIGKNRGGRMKFSVQSGNTAKIKGMETQARALITVAQETMDTDPMAINATNGTLRVVEAPPDPDDDGKIRLKIQLDPHRREDRIAKVLGAAYDPKAEAPQWMAFLEKVQPKAPIRRFLQMWSGVSLTGILMQHFVFHYGFGANGKSVFMETLGRVAGLYCKALPAEAITGDLQRRGDQATPEFARLPGVRMIRCAELQRGQAIKESIIKLLTGGESMVVRHLHKEFFEFKPTGKASGSGNDKPPIGGVDEGIWRRMKLVPWTITIPVEERRDFEEMVASLMTEASGILNWALEGLLDFKREGLVVPEEIRAATDDYRDEMDPIGSFVAACVRPKPDAKVTARVMFKSYEAWCHANSVRRFAESTFARTMQQKGMKKTDGRIREYLDVELHDVPEDPDARPDRGQGRLDDGGTWTQMDGD